MTIGLTMMVKDEEANIGRCLESAKPFIDNWTILDTGSTDRTPDIIADLLGDREGALHHGEFVNFAVSRSELLGHAHGTADYLMLLDADMQVVYQDERLPKLTADCYEGTILTPPIEYALPILVKGDRKWRYEGVAHSFLACEGPWSNETLPGLKIIDGSHTGPDKLRRDLELLSAEHARNPLHARTVFYLAQTYFDLDMFDESIQTYRLRANMDGWDEETFMARYRLGTLLCEHVSFAAGAKELLAAWEMRPHRIEPLRVLSNVADSVADKYPLPTDRLFVGVSHYRRASRPAKSDIEEIFFQRYTPHPGDVVVELGAAEGSETGILCDMVGPSGQVLAVEAHPRTFAVLKEACRPRSQLKLVNAAVSDTPGIGTISDGGIAWRNHLTDGEGINVTMRTLDQITAKLTQIDFLKINIEGVEADVIERSAKTLAKTFAVAVSCHDFVGTPTKARVRAALEQAGFTVWEHDDPHVIEDGHNGRCLGDYLYAKRVPKVSEVSAVIVTRGNVDLGPTLEPLPFSNIRIWDNSQRGADLKTYGRVKVLDECENEIVFSVDDDVIFTECDRLLEAYEPRRLVCNMDQSWIDGAGYGDWHHLTGAGSVYDRAVPKRAVERYLDEFPYDDEFLTWCDAIVGTLAAGKRVDLGYQAREFTDDPGRLWTTPGNHEAKWKMINRCLAMT